MPSGPQEKPAKYSTSVVVLAMDALLEYPFNHHPCYSNRRENLWARIHLPVAPICNVKCAFCEHGYGSACHSSKPGFSSKIISVDQALQRLEQELAALDSLKIVAVSGPGEPLANSQTIELFTRVREKHEDLKICFSTNGTLLGKNIGVLADLGIDTISVSISALEPATAASIYEWAVMDRKRLTGEAMGEAVVNAQLDGVEKAAEADITVKVNTILIPGINHNEVARVAKAVAKAGAAIQNVVPLVPAGNMKHLKPPSSGELAAARAACSRFISQFLHCQQCRSDVVGVPGADKIL